VENSSKIYLAKNVTEKAFLPNHMETYWTRPQVAQIVGISYDTLDYWVKSGLITPSVVVPHPSSTRGYFSLSNIVALAAIKALRDRGISLQQVKKIRSEFCHRIGLSFEQGLRGGVIVADGHDILTVLYTLDDAVQIMSLLKGGQMILPLDNIVTEVMERVERMFGEADARLPAISFLGKEVHNER